jgi:hypothetical protein
VSDHRNRRASKCATKAKTLKTNCGSYALGGLRKRRAANDRDEPERQERDCCRFVALNLDLPHGERSPPVERARR